VDQTPYNATVGYGWTAGTGLSVQQRSGPDALHQKFIQGPTDGSVATFKINVDPGTYKFTFHLGDQTQDHTGMQFSVNGTPIDQNITTLAGQFFDQTWTVQVVDTQASISISAVPGSSFALDALDITSFLDVSVAIPTNMTVNTPGNFTLTVNNAPADATWTYDFTFQDGSDTQESTVSAATFTQHHAYEVNGHYRPALQVTDQSGNFFLTYVDEEVTGPSIFHVIQNEGDDSWDGSADHPWASLAGVLGHDRFGPGDQIQLQAGNVFPGPFVLDGSKLQGTPGNPVIITSSAGGRAEIDSDFFSDGIDILNAGAVHIQSVDVRGAWLHGSTPPSNSSQSAIAFRNTSGQTFSDISIDDVNITGYAGVTIQVFADHTSHYQNVSITRCNLVTNFGSGVFVTSDVQTPVYQIQNLHIDRVQIFDNWSIPGTLYSASAIYIQNVQRAVVEHAWVLGDDLSGRTNLGGGFGIACSECDKVVFQNDESAHNVTHGAPGDSGGFDFDTGTSNSVMQYDYSHDNDGPGFLLSGGNEAIGGPNTNNIIRYCITQNDSRQNFYAGIALTAGGPVYNADIYNNTVYIGPNDAQTHVAAFSAQDDTVPTNVRVRNNIFVTYGGIPVISVVDIGSITFQGNVLNSGNDPVIIEWGHDADYHPISYVGLDGPNGVRSVVPDFEMVNGVSVAVLADPMLVGIGLGGTVGPDQTLADGLPVYRMQTGSPIATAGVNLAAQGITWDPAGLTTDSFLGQYLVSTPTDFFGHAYGQRTTWSIGADQGP
jgi:hypothetical protein